MGLKWGLMVSSTSKCFTAAAGAALDVVYTNLDLSSQQLLVALEDIERTYTTSI